ncbi:unnamed protein product, partial [Prunus brigantina]
FRIRELLNWFRRFCVNMSKDEFKHDIPFTLLYDDKRVMVDKQLELLVFLFPHWISITQINDKLLLIKREETEEVEVHLQLAICSICPP